jgi:hypothetical protein
MDLDNQEKKSIAAIVRGEIMNEGKDKYPDASFEERALAYMNNFYCKLPSKSGMDYEEAYAKRHHPEDMPEILERRKVSEIDKSFLSLNPVYDKGKTKEQLFDELKGHGFSERYLLGTRESLLSDVHTAIEQSGVDESALKECIENIRKSDTGTIVQFLLPVYIKLREMGYSHEDLRIS